MPGNQEAKQMHEYVIFELAGEHYAVDVSPVEEILRMAEITEVPHAPSFVEGIMNFRGNVMPVIDLRRRLGLPTSEHTKNTRIMAVSLNSGTVGMIVDAVSEVAEIPPEIVEPPSPIILDVDTDFLTGIAKMGSDDQEGKLVVILDLVKVLSDKSQKELAEFSEAMAADDV
ncbi:MAG TPA: chemotaxis protein CheW [Bacillota bacterium]|nr:chemotaxis protein CheW [Bacillota bacterium]